MWYMSHTCVLMYINIIWAILVCWYTSTLYEPYLCVDIHQHYMSHTCVLIYINIMWAMPMCWYTSTLYEPYMCVDIHQHYMSHTCVLIYINIIWTIPVCWYTSTLYEPYLCVDIHQHYMSHACVLIYINSFHQGLVVIFVGDFKLKCFFGKNFNDNFSASVEYITSGDNCDRVNLRSGFMNSGIQFSVNKRDWSLYGYHLGGNWYNFTGQSAVWCCDYIGIWHWKHYRIAWLIMFQYKGCPSMYLDAIIKIRLSWDILS